MRGSSILILILAFLGLAAGWQVSSYRIANQDRAQRIEVMQNLKLRLLRQHANIDGETLPTLSADVAWVPSTTVTTDQQLQSWALDALRRNDLAIRQYQQTQIDTDIDVETLSLRLEFTGPLAGLVSLISEIETHRPALGITNLHIRPLGNRDQIAGVTIVNGHITIWGIAAENDA